MTVDDVVLAVASADVGRAETLAETAATLAGPADATVHLVHALTAERFESRVELLDFDPELPPSPGEVAERVTAVRAVRAALGRLARADGFTVEVHGLVGDDAEATAVSFVADVDGDHLVASADDSPGLRDALFGGADRTMLRDATCPVTFVREEREPEPGSRGDLEAAPSRTPLLWSLRGG